MSKNKGSAEKKDYRTGLGLFMLLIVIFYSVR